ncbi:MAG: hypothetical protein COW30_16075 [Rhodospirillales bacterium CG15_BIG_FIL_POST_REV_8_21_14_020_66_15]|nr:MAG: hypothetical protein COW30_16075 [Rhodospirillales bacterium CG15_BIG_FIL_POST_REV_8_21_14_020_66_15]
MPFAANNPRYKLTTHGRLVLRIEALLGIMSVAELAERYGVKRQSAYSLLRYLDLRETDAVGRFKANMEMLYLLWAQDAMACNDPTPWPQALQAALEEAKQEPIRIVSAAIDRLTEIECAAAEFDLAEAMDAANVRGGRSKA